MDVVVIGAGPVGKVAALALADAGVPVHLIDTRAGEDRARIESKAIRLAPASIAILDGFGLGRTIRAEGVTWTRERVQFRDEDMFTRNIMAAPDAPFVNLPQWRTDELLLDRIAANPLVELSWSTALDHLEQDADRVALGVRRPGRGTDEILARYVVCCDGARSTGRRLLGIPFPGHDYPDRFLITDIDADLPQPDERRFCFSPAVNPGRQVMLMRQRDRLWRVDFQVGEDAPAGGPDLRAWLAARLPVLLDGAGYEIRWVSSYRFACRRVASPRVHRVLLAGDCAHVVSPFGGRGLNSGVIDVASLAPVLAAAVRGELSPDRVDAALDRWAGHRATAAAHHLAETDAAMRFMLPGTPDAKARRDAVLAASATDPTRRPHVNTGRPFDEPTELPRFLSGDGAPDAPRPTGQRAEPMSGTEQKPG